MLQGPPPEILSSGFLLLGIAAAAFWLTETARRAHDGAPARVRSLRILSSVLCLAMALLLLVYFLADVSTLSRVTFGLAGILEIVIMALLVVILVLVALHHLAPARD